MTPQITTHITTQMTAQITIQMTTHITHISILMNMQSDARITKQNDIVNNYCEYF